MKKTAIATAALLSVTLFSTVAPAVNAATPSDTHGDVNFTENTTNPGGELDLVSAPDFDFGDNPISGSDASYDQATVTTPIEVDDNRGSNVGWNLSVANTQFTGTTTTTSELKGAVLTITPDTTVANDNKNNAAILATSTEAVLDGSSTGVNIFDAKADQGMGKNTVTVTKANLSVPGETAKLKEKYESTITWTLANAAL